MAGKKSKNANPRNAHVDHTRLNPQASNSANDAWDAESNLEDGSTAASLPLIREVPRPRLMMALAITYAVWLSLLVWLACSIL